MTANFIAPNRRIYISNVIARPWTFIQIRIFMNTSKKKKKKIEANQKFVSLTEY